jgi:hypothetical protein
LADDDPQSSSDPSLAEAHEPRPLPEWNEAQESSALALNSANTPISTPGNFSFHKSVSINELHAATDPLSPILNTNYASVPKRTG